MAMRNSQQQEQQRPEEQQEWLSDCRDEMSDAEVDAEWSEAGYDLPESEFELSYFTEEPSYREHTCFFRNEQAAEAYCSRNNVQSYQIMYWGISDIPF